MKMFSDSEPVTIRSHGFAFWLGHVAFYVCHWREIKRLDRDLQKIRGRS